MLLLDLFAASLVGQRDEIAIDADHPDGRPISATFGDLDDRSSRLARVFARRGLAPGDRLAIYLTNRLEFVDVLLACLKLGAIVVPVNILYREREIAHILQDADPRAVVAAEGANERVPPHAEIWDIDVLSAEAAGESEAPMRPGIDGDAPAVLVYTSGTTGRSKGAILSHNNVLANTVNLTACWRITAADRYLAVLPLFHVHGLVNGVMTWLATGCRTRLVERFELSRATELFAGFQPTLFFGVPTIYHRLLELSADVARDIGSRMRLFVSGSAPLPPGVFEAFRERFGHTILERYGMSETLMTIGNPYAGARRAGSVGRPLPGIAARIVREDGAMARCGEIGELQVRGPTLFSGYWRQPETTAAAFVDGWFRTGDLAERTDDGYYTLRGRRTDLIISGGFNIYPREIEDVLAALPGIREAVVVGVPDEHRGELPVAYLVAEAPIETSMLEARCRENLASFKVPRAFIQVESLPRTALGKVQKRLLPPWRSSP